MIQNNAAHTKFLEETIIHYWKQRGFSVKIIIESIERTTKLSNQFYQIRSDMINGLPKEFFQPVKESNLSNSSKA